MARFFAAAASAAGGTVLLTGNDAAHAKVLRLRVGDEIIICDGLGTERKCTITRMNASEVEAEILSEKASDAEPTVKVKILAGYPKGERSDLIIQKCTELGASEITFFLCDRCVARPDSRSIEGKLQRFRRIAEEAAKQSGRAIIPEISFLETYAEALNAAVKTELPLFMYETGERVTLREAITAKPGISSAAIITGPEGGFEKYEADLASACGIKLCSMGPRIMRCETAPAAALAALMYETGNF